MYTAELSGYVETNWYIILITMGKTLLMTVHYCILKSVINGVAIAFNESIFCNEGQLPNNNKSVVKRKTQQ